MVHTVKKLSMWFPEIGFCVVMCKIETFKFGLHIGIQ